ncbi:lipoyl(octanoyl) transferase [Plasticicumulans lactativorans]|uniref:Octanoyltransferase n=1 Tax=Plasticicumulans lactativorans TaxID=1133106 RepID=A0A4R2L4W1_9GAMM|nr:lipoyl(octanoyl) transferase LipB [Plasticicumulans lactativorans]TCO78886.1 lipoyl(octanoyl) transferase [Plasticicumulans lactativorans]
MKRPAGERQAVVRDLGLRAYAPVFAAMQAFTSARDESTPDEIWRVQHPPVFTQGLAGKAEHLLATGDIPVVQVDRGGQVTYHGPGQLVIYTLLDLVRAGLGVRALVSALEGSVIDLLAGFGIDAHARPDAPGVYVAGAKIASLGLRVRRGRSYHGVAFNIDMDLEPFARINPCGYAGLAITQLRDLQPNFEWQKVTDDLLHHLAVRLDYTALPAVREPPTALIEDA